MTRGAPQTSDEQFQLALDAQPSAMLMVNQRGDVVLANSQAEKLFERTRADLVGKPVQLVVPGLTKPQQNQTPSQSDTGGQPRLELRLRRADGTEVPVEVIANQVDPGSRAARTLYSIVDITEYKRIDAILQESEARFRTMADTAPVMIWISDATKLCTFFNKVWLDFTGRKVEQELGIGWAEGVHADDLAECMQTYTTSFDARESFRMEYRLRRADGEYRWVLDNGVPLFSADGIFSGYIGSCIDITDSRRSQQEAFSRQKLESLGVATTRVAHDFGNLLSGIIGHVELMLDDLAPGSQVARNAAAIFDLASRGSEIVKELMVYTGQDEPQVELLDLSQIIQQMHELLKISVSKRAVLKTHFGENVPSVLANAAHIRQIVMHLVMNASEAIQDQPGTIEIATSHFAVKPGDDLESAGLPLGQYACLSVSDTGAGMTPELQTKIFDPFFTTKPDGRGLGLSVTDGIVRRYGGRVIVTSAPLRGSRFEIVLPRAGQFTQQQTAKTGK